MDNETADDIKRHIDVVAEGLRSEIRTVDEKAERRFDGIDQRFDGIDQRFDGINQRFDGIDQRFDGTDQRFDGVDQRLNGVDQKFNGVNQRFDELKRHFDVVGESLRGDIRLVTEGLIGAEERSAREFERVRDEIGEVKSLVRISYGELDRRMQALERKPS
jgi:archaellum component FlaC